MSLHHNARACAVHSVLPGAAKARNPTVRQFIGVFAEVPDISLFVLSEPIKRVFGKFAIGEDLVVNFNAGDSVNQLRVSGHRERSLDKALGRRAFVNVGRPGLQRQVRIVNMSSQVRGVDRGIVRSATQFLAIFGYAR